MNRALVFLYDPAREGTGSTVARAKDLSRIAHFGYSGLREVRYTGESNITHSIVFLVRESLIRLGNEGLQKLKERDNILIADFVDLIPDVNLVEISDVLLASSISQYAYFKNNFKDKPTFHLTHQGNQYLSAFNSRQLGTKIRICYVGEPLNTIIPAKNQGDIDVIHVDTSKNIMNWVEKVQPYSCHYAIRNRRKFDGFKPFIKGFTAAHCGANIIIQKDAFSNPDLQFYLGDDYPYLLDENPTEHMITEMITRVQESAGTSEWNYGMSIMEYIKACSSPPMVFREFTRIIKEIDKL